MSIDQDGVSLEIWILEFGIWILEFGIWILEFGIWNLDLGIWNSDLKKSGKWVSNPRPSAWEADALPTELLPH